MTFSRYIYGAVALLLFFTGCTPDESRFLAFEPVSRMPQARTAAAVAVSGHAAYIFGGRAGTAGNIRGDFWKYTPLDGTWQQLPASPLKARTGAVAMAVDSLLYIGLGFNGRPYCDSCYLRDWWSYRPATRQWTRLADYPSKYTAAASSFTDGKTIYVCFGSYDWSDEHMYAYHIADNSWEELNVGYYGLVDAVAATVDGRHFGGTNGHWYEFDAAARIWQPRTAYRKDGSWLSSALLPYGHKLYMFGGREATGVASKEDVLQYDPSADRWTVCGRLPQGAGRENLVAFVIDGKAYIGLGETRDSVCAAIYRINFQPWQ